MRSALPSSMLAIATPPSRSAVTAFASVRSGIGMQPTHVAVGAGTGGVDLERLDRIAPAAVHGVQKARDGGRARAARGRRSRTCSGPAGRSIAGYGSRVQPARGACGIQHLDAAARGVDALQRVRCAEGQAACDQPARAGHSDAVLCCVDAADECHGAVCGAVLSQRARCRRDATRRSRRAAARGMIAVRIGIGLPPAAGGAASEPMLT